MATVLRPPLPARAESNTLRAFEERMRAYLDERLQVRTRFASLGGTRALLVSPADRERAKGLVIDADTSTAERVYMYVHVAAHIALGHNIPLVTIVESDDVDADQMKHELAERLTRSMWWRGADAEVAASLPAVRTSRVLRSLLSWGATRALTRWALLAIRALAYRTGIVRALERNAATAWLGQALCVAAVVSAAPQLAGERG
ncbi:MAG TPA: hypothetical protein VGA16_05750 [Candidatus Limnocylindria bacterium]